MRRFLLHKSKHVVHIKLYIATLVSGIRRDRAGRESPDSCNASEPNAEY